MAEKDREEAPAKPQNSDAKPAAELKKPPPSLLDVFAGDGYLRIEKWYKDFEDYTFKTTVFEFAWPEAKALLEYKKAQQHVLMGRQAAGLEKDPNFVLVLDGRTSKDVQNEVEDLLTDEEKQGLKTFRAKLDEAIASLGGNGKGVFLKTSSRSPKDAVFLNKTMYQVISERVNKDMKDHPNATPEEQNIADAKIFIQACGHAMKVHNTDEAIDLFLNSRRTRDDIQACALQFGEKAFEMSILVREWVDIDPVWEFRTFVFNGQLNAITHYNSICYVPEIAKRSEEIKTKLYKFWKKHMKKRCKLDTYTIDFAFDPASDKIWMIELNPPLERRYSSGKIKQTKPRSRMGLWKFESGLNPWPIRSTRYTLPADANFACDKCQAKPITRVWFTCGICGAYDLCSKCQAESKPETQDWGYAHTHGRWYQFTSNAPAEPEEELPGQEDKPAAGSGGCSSM